MKLSNLVSACIVALSATGCASLQEDVKFPTRAVTVIVPYPQGNTADVVARTVAEKLAQLWGQAVTVENRPGPVTVPGVDAVAKAVPDGHTLLAHSISFAVDAGLYSNLPYSPEKDFTAVAPFARQPFALVASPSLGVKSVAELVARSRSGPLKFASLGTTTQIYFIGEQFKKQAGFSATNASYKSLAEGNAAVAKGEAAFWFPPVAGAVAGIRDGKLIPLAVTGDKRMAMLPQVPTMAEAGVSGMESAAWFGMWAPSGVPAGVVARIAKDVERAVASPEVMDKLAKLGAEPMRMTPSQFAAFVRAETDASRRFVTELGIRPQPYAVPAK